MKTEQIKSMGYKPATKAEVIRKLAELGYTLDRSADCFSMARFMSGPNEGARVPTVSLYAREADTGLSAFNANARRDARFTEFQRLRSESALCWIYAGRVYEV